MKGKGIVIKQETETKISNDIHKRYRSSIESLLYLVKNHDTNYSTHYVRYQNIWTREKKVITRILYMQPITKYKQILLLPDEIRNKHKWTMVTMWIK